MSNEKYDSPSKSELGEDESSMQKRHSGNGRVRDSGTASDSLVERYRKGKRRHGKELLVMRALNDRFQEVLDYGTYHLVDKSSHHDDAVREASQNRASFYRSK